MVKGTTSFGNKAKSKTHIRCRRCGGHSYHATKKTCSSCGFGSSPKLRSYKWNHYR